MFITSWFIIMLIIHLKGLYFKNDIKKLFYIIKFVLNTNRFHIKNVRFLYKKLYLELQYSYNLFSMLVDKQSLKKIGKYV